MKSSPVVTSVIVAFGTAVLWLGAVTAGVLENSGGSWARDMRKYLFRNDSHELMETWSIDVTLPKWSLCIWEFIYTWNTLWILYCVAITCRPVSDKSRENSVTCSVNAFPSLFYCFWSFAALSHVCWMLFWDREILVGSVFFQAFVVTACIGCLCISLTSVDRNGSQLQESYPWDLWVCRTLVQNGIAMHCTWSAVLFFVNVASLLTHKAAIPSYLTSMATLGAIAFVLLFWFILETFVLDRWTRYIFGVYPVMTWTSAAILLRHFRPWSYITIFSLAIFAASTTFAIIRMPLVVWRSFSFPLYLKQTLPQKVGFIMNEIQSEPEIGDMRGDKHKKRPLPMEPISLA